MTTEGEVLTEYRTRLRLVVLTMVLNLLWMIFFLPIFPVPDDTSDSIGAGGAFMCFGLWMGLLVLFSAMLLWVVVKGNEVAMVLGSIMTWLFFFGIISLGYAVWILLLNILIPMSLTASIVMMIRLTEKMRSVRDPEEPIDYPVARRL